MAYAMTKQGSLDNCITYEFICDTISDMNAIENRYRTIGTVAIVLKGENEGLEVYIAGSDRQWNNLTSMGASGGGGGSSDDGTLALRVAVLEAQIASLIEALQSLLGIAPETSVTLEDGTSVTDESGNNIIYDTPTT